MKVAQWYFNLLKRLFDKKRYFTFYFCLWGVPQFLMIIIIFILKQLNILPWKNQSSY